MNQIPNHIAFIMDGNRRWAVEHGLPKMEGHTKGLENFKVVVDYCRELGVKYTTFWALSTDNLKKREDLELQHLFKLLGDIRNYLLDFMKHEVNVSYIGDLTKLPSWLRTILDDVKAKTEKNNKFFLTLAINYGGHDEIVRMAKQVVSIAESSNQISEDVVTSLMDTGKLPPPEIIIRTGGHQRLSGFLPWLNDYSELYFTDTKWPAFDKAELDKALEWLGKQERNFGK